MPWVESIQESAAVCKEFAATEAKFAQVLRQLCETLVPVLRMHAEGEDEKKMLAAMAAALERLIRLHEHVAARCVCCAEASDCFTVAECLQQVVC